jgi:tetratricopeptide (TPR) repeat protein
MGRYDRADSVLEVAVEVDPMAGAKTGLLTGTAKFYIGAKQLDKAEQMSLRALRCSPQDWRANQTLGLVYELQDRYEEAEERNKMLLELGQGRGYTPDPLADLVQMGRLYLVQKDYVRAEMWLREVLEVDSHHPPALRHLGYLFSQRLQYNEARQYADQALERDSSFFSYTLMAWILTVGDFDADLGIAFEQMALDHPPEDDPTDAYLITKPFVPLPQHSLGLAYLKKQEYSLALQYLEQAATLRPSDSKITEDLQAVREQLKI